MIDVELQKELSKYNPEGSELRRVQLRILDILIEFDRICRKNNIAYWLDSGTLIGAVRHGGFIPWDDDLDVCVLRSDMPKLRKAMLADLDSKYTFRDIDMESKRTWCRIENMNIVMTRRQPSGAIKDDYLWIDIFEVEPGCKLTKQITEATYGKCLRRKVNMFYDGAFKHAMAVALLPIMRVFVALVRLWCRIAHRHTYVHVYGNMFHSIRKHDDIFPLSEIDFEGHNFYAPGNVDNYLRRIYGDYMQVPPVEKRISHGIIAINGMD